MSYSSPKGAIEFVWDDRRAQGAKASLRRAYRRAGEHQCQDLRYSCVTTVTIRAFGSTAYAFRKYLTYTWAAQ